MDKQTKLLGSETWWTAYNSGIFEGYQKAGAFLKAFRGIDREQYNGSKSRRKCCKWEVICIRCSGA